MPTPKTEWLVWFYADNAFRKTTGGQTHEFTEATRYTYNDTRDLVVYAAIGEWPDGQPPAVMIPVLPEQPLGAMAREGQVADLIRAAMIRMSDDRDTADWSHPVPTGGLPEDPDASTALPGHVPTLGELVAATRNRFVKAQLATQDACVSRDVDPLVAEYYKALGALDAVEDQWQTQMRSTR